MLRPFSLFQNAGRKEGREGGKKGDARKRGYPACPLYMPDECLTVFSLTNQFNKNTATVEHTKFKLDPAQNNYSVDVDDDGAI